MKKCPKCGEEKEFSLFCKATANPDGYYAWCKPCANAKRKEYRNNNLESERAKRREYYARNTERVLSTNAKSQKKNRESVLQWKRDHYHKIKGTKEYKEQSAKYIEENKESKASYDREYRIKNRARLNEVSLEWQKNKKEKVRAAKSRCKAKRRAKESIGCSTAEVAEWILGQKMDCYWCDKDCKSEYHIDHYEPLSRGGMHEIENLVIACPRCNLTKNARDPFEFAKEVGRLF